MATTFDRKEKLIEDIMKTMEKRSSEELKNIFARNDVDRYSDEAFEAMERLLTQRGEGIPYRDKGKKRKLMTGKPKTILGIGWRGLSFALLLWAPVIIFLAFSFGIEELLYAERIHQAIAGGIFMISAILAEKFIFWAKN
ncbi:MAG: hypothetical protein HY809_06900 [Nitrospirae bacterium]|nr:hypothetical protein [Nitrospirota bacterium]